MFSEELIKQCNNMLDAIKLNNFSVSGVVNFYDFSEDEVRKECLIAQAKVRGMWDGE